MRNKTAILCLLIFAGFAISADENPERHLKFLRNASTENGQASGKDIFSIRLDSKIYDAVSADFSDIRILDEINRQVQFIIDKQVIEESSFIEKFIHSKIISLEKLENNSMELTVEPDENNNIPISRITIETPNKNFEKKISVSGSQDGKSWQMLAGDALLFDYSQIADVSNFSVKFDPALFKFYKVLISNFSENSTSPYREIITEQVKGEESKRTEKITISSEALKIDAIGLYGKIRETSTKRNEEMEYEVEKEFLPEKDGKSTMVITTMRQPLVKLEIEPAGKNFSRHAILESSDDKKSWQHICDSRLLDINLAGYSEKSCAFSFPEHREKFYRITIFNGDAAPVKFPKVKAFGNVYRADFLNEKNDAKSFLFFFGGEGAIKKPEYDIGTVLSKIKKPSYEKLVLGKIENNPDYTVFEKKKPLFDSKAILISAIVLMMVVLSLIVALNIRKIDK